MTAGAFTSGREVFSRLFGSLLRALRAVNWPVSAA